MSYDFCVSSQAHKHNQAPIQSAHLPQAEETLSAPILQGEKRITQCTWSLQAVNTSLEEQHLGNKGVSAMENEV